MDKLLLVDGSNLLFQMYFGMPNKIMGKSQHIEGVVGFIGALRNILKMLDPKYVLVVFDGENLLERKTIDENYKSNRIDYSKEDDNPYNQLPLIKDVLNYLQIKFYETTTQETDDLIAGLTQKYNNLNIVISSHDTDFYQLVNDFVSIFKYRGKASLIETKETIKEKLKIDCCYYADFKSLTGDSADNIQGIKGVGKVTAASLINEFLSIENLIDNSCFIKKEPLKKLITENKDKLLKNKKLISLKEKTPEIVLEFNECEKFMKEFKTMEILKLLNLI